MRHFSKELRQSVYKALLCAQSAASIQQTLCKFEDPAMDAAARDQFRHMSEAAYAAASHAWTAMSALVSNNLAAAEEAALATADAEATIMTISQDILPQGIYLPDRKHMLEQPPDEKGLYRLWDEFYLSLPFPYPVPEGLEPGTQDNRPN